MPQPGAIAIESTTIAVDGFDPLQAYAALSAQLGFNNVAMLESAAGNVQSARVSHILIAPIFTLSVSGSEVEFSGKEAVVSAVRDACASKGFTSASSGVLLQKRSDLWNLFRTIRDLFDDHHGSNTDDFHFGFFGYLGYDVAWAIEDLPVIIPRTKEVPDAMLSIHAGHAQIELTTGKAKLVLHHAPGYFDAPDGALIQEALGKDVGAVGQAPDIPAPNHIEETINRERYLDKVITAKEHIAAGDIYQVQVGHELRVHTQATPFDIYRRLRAKNPSPYMFLGTFEDMTISGASPEICVLVERDEVTVRPIAGTIRRGSNPEEDFELVNQLLSDEKEIAEHVMLVDLGRNDVGRVSVPRTLNVNELMVIEQYSHVSHIVSNVVGKLRPEADNFDAIAATFPAGTVTGAPKVRAMEIIETLENTQRGAYAGAVGLIDFGGYCITALGLRSTVHRNGVFRLRASAGVVADSKPENEWQETLAKMAAPFWATTGKEIADAGLGG